MSKDAATVTRTTLCRLDEIEDGAARGFSVETADGPLELFVVREGRSLFGYVNSCPHVGTPLDLRPHDFMSEDGTYIQCATHGALFQIDDGACIAGPCAGEHLQPLAVALDDEERVVLTLTERD